MKIARLRNLIKEVLLVEGQFEDLALQLRPKISITDTQSDPAKQVIFDRLVTALSSNALLKKPEFLRWAWKMVQQASRGEQATIVSEVFNLLLNFQEKKQRLPIEKRNINAFQKLGDLRGELENLGASKSDEKKIALQGATQIYKNDQFKVYRVTTEEASCVLGRGTKWCIAATQSENMFKTYSAQHNRFCFVLKDAEKWAVLFRPQMEKDVDLPKFTDDRHFNIEIYNSEDDVVSDCFDSIEVCEQMLSQFFHDVGVSSAIGREIQKYNQEISADSSVISDILATGNLENFRDLDETKKQWIIEKSIRNAVYKHHSKLFKNIAMMPDLSNAILFKMIDGLTSERPMPVALLRFLAENSLRFFEREKQRDETSLKDHDLNDMFYALLSCGAFKNEMLLTLATVESPSLSYRQVAVMNSTLLQYGPTRDRLASFILEKEEKKSDSYDDLDEVRDNAVLSVVKNNVSIDKIEKAIKILINQHQNDVGYDFFRDEWLNVVFKKFLGDPESNVRSLREKEDLSPALAEKLVSLFAEHENAFQQEKKRSYEPDSSKWDLVSLARRSYSSAILNAICNLGNDELQIAMASRRKPLPQDIVEKLSHNNSPDIQAALTKWKR